MNALHEAVTRAIASAQHERQYDPATRGIFAGEWRAVRYERVESQEERDLRAARAAIRVVLAEATRSIEALRAKCHDAGPDERLDTMAALDEALAVLAALAEDDA